MIRYSQSTQVQKIRTQTWIALIVVAVGLVPIGVLGLFMYMSATATPLHTNQQAVPSAPGATVRQWASAVEQAQQIVRASVVEQNLPGLSVAVGIAGEIVWAEGFGWADLEKKLPVSPEMPFRIGTASTALTSAAVGLLIEQNRLKLDEKIQTYVPEFPEQKWPVTLRQVMGHTAGVSSDGGDEGPLFGVHCDRTVEALPHFAKDPLGFEPGTEYRFSNFGFILVSAAIEAVADEPFLTFMRKQLFEPLGMNNTRADSPTDPDRATSYFPKFAADPRYGPDPMREIDLSCYAGSSALLSTPSDLVRFAMAMNSGTLLQPATVQLLQTSQRLRSGKETGYGLGWDLESVEWSGKHTGLVGHDGELLGGTAVSFMTFPEYGIVVGVTSNTSYANTSAIAVRIAQAFAEQPKNSSSPQ